MQIIIDTTVKYWVTALCGIAFALIAALWRKLNKEIKKQKAINGAVLALLRDRINESCRYHLQNKKISNRDYEVIEHMFNEYFAMGGNGVVAHLKEEIDKLEVVMVEVH